MATLADKAGQYDGDGIDVYFLNSKRNGVKMRVHSDACSHHERRRLTLIHVQNARSVLQLFDQVKPGGATPIGDRLEELLMDYMEELERVKTLQAVRNIKPLNIIVITDGAPSMFSAFL